jgi:enoyl reductase-like protein
VSLLNNFAFTYDFSENDKKSLKDILMRSVSSTVTLSSNDLKADLYQLQALIFRLNLKIDKDIFDLESLKMNPNELIKILKKAEKKYLNKIKNDSIKKAIEVLEKDNKEVITENIHSLVPDIQKEDIDRYLKRLDSVKKARAKNSKVLGSES